MRNPTFAKTFFFYVLWWHFCIYFDLNIVSLALERFVTSLNSAPKGSASFGPPSPGAAEPSPLLPLPVMSAASVSVSAFPLKWGPGDPGNPLYSCP
jgi:hypothetical protein